MLLNDDNVAQRNERITNAPLWGDTDPNNDIVWLAELLQQTWRKVMHGLNFSWRPECSLDRVWAAEIILDVRVCLDTEVEKRLKIVR
jgi:hypothetical protein